MIHNLRKILRYLGWTNASTYLLSAFLAIISLIIIVWWPLVTDYFNQINPDYPIWVQIDWLLIGIFAFMSLAIMAGADLRRDAGIIVVGFFGGLVIESWGTQSGIWHYFTNEKPPLWILPAWPIASLTIDRLVRFFDHWIPLNTAQYFQPVYGPIFALFLVLMGFFVWPFLNQPWTILAFFSCVLLIFSPGNPRMALLNFLAGSALGYFLEVWGTTRACWTYYTLQTPPPFAIFAHGLAAFAFWRVGGLLWIIFIHCLNAMRRKHSRLTFS